MKMKALLIALFGLFWQIDFSQSRAVNISNTWTLPQPGFNVFYRYFRDKISWFEADAVCQFHHANLVTVENVEQFDATRGFLKQLEIVDNVWIGLMRPSNADQFAWSSSKPLLASEGYWAEPWALTEMPLCAVIDPSKDFRWHALGCGGPETAGFLCEMEVPDWAIQCTEQPDVTVQYISDNGNVELTRSCKSFEKSLACQNNMDKIAVLNELKCPEDDIIVDETTLKEEEETSSSTEMPTTNLAVESSSSSTSSESSVMESRTPVVIIASQPKVLTVEKLSFDDDVILPLAEINDNQLDVDSKHADDLMMGDQPADSEILPPLTPPAMDGDDDKKFLLKQSEKSKKDIEPKKKSAAMKKEQLKAKDEEHMMGDSPASGDEEKIDIPTTDRQRRDADETTQPIVVTTEEIIVSSSTAQSTDDLSTTTEDAATTVTDSAVEETTSATEIPETTSTIQATTSTTTEQPTTKFIVQGHPLFHSQTIFKDPIPQHQENTNANLERKDVGNTDDHFVPPMLLVKSRFQAKASEHDEQVKDTTTEIVTENNFDFNITDVNDDNSTDVSELELTTVSSSSTSSTTPSPGATLNSTSATTTESSDDENKLIKVDKRNDPRLGLNVNAKTTSKATLTTVESDSTSPDEPEDVSTTTEEFSSVTESTQRVEEEQDEAEAITSTDSAVNEATTSYVEVPSTTEEANEASTFAAFSSSADSLIVANELSAAATPISADEKSTVSPTTTENAVEILSTDGKNVETPLSELIEISTSAKHVVVDSITETAEDATQAPKPKRMKPTATIAQQFTNEISDHYEISEQLETEGEDEDEQQHTHHVENNLNNEDYEPWKPVRHRSLSKQDHRHGSGMSIGRILGK